MIRPSRYTPGQMTYDLRRPRRLGTANDQLVHLRSR